MAIDTTKDFTKSVGSLVKAGKLVRSLLEEGENMSQTAGMRGRTIAYAYGTQKNFKWSYNPEYKTVSVTYTDGRPAPEEKPKPEFYVVWIEGLSAERGEKIQTLDSDHTFTTKMTEALRVKPEHVERVRAILLEQGVAKWAIEGAGTFHKVHYAPKGTIYQP